MSNAVIPAPMRFDQNGGAFAFRSGTAIAYINVDVAPIVDRSWGASCSRSQGCDHQHSNRVQRRRRPCAARACCEPRPGGNLTGSNGFIGEFGARSLALLHELVSSAPV